MIRLTRFLTSLVLPMTLLLAPREAATRTWNIFVDGSGAAPTIQAGIDSAIAGDSVLVHPGIYFERLTFRGRDIVVLSLSGPNQTVLDGAGLGGRVVRISSGESRATLLEGFTITHGLGGVIINGAQPTIKRNIITDNDAAPEDGGGIWCTAGTFFPWFPLIQENVITNNRGRNLAGGIGFGQRMVPDVLDNHIEGNEATDGDGGGIYYRSFENGAVIRGNTVLNNRAGDHGGGIYVWHVGDIGLLEVEVSWNLVAGNYARGSEITGNSGAGIWLWETNAWVHHNTIALNEGDGPTNAYGGGIVIERPGSPTIEQNIIAFNAKGGGIWCGGGATPIIQNNFAWQNTGGDGVKDCPSWWQSDGNVIDNPYFCDLANGDYTVASNSGVMTHLAGPLGAFSIPGCGPVAAQPSTWGTLKTRYLSSH
jgi:parallel beta helix pectate lyase-like protein